jgi:hypothetical protein
MSIKALSEYTRYSKYSRYLPEKQRRETWSEQVNRVFDMHKEKLEDKYEHCSSVVNQSYVIMQNFIIALQVMQIVLKSSRNLSSCCSVVVVLACLYSTTT